jgi:hypothetical protein
VEALILSTVLVLTLVVAAGFAKGILTLVLRLMANEIPAVGAR